MIPEDAEAREREMVLALGLFDLTERDRQLLRWLSTWPRETTDAVSDLLARASRPPVSRGAASRP